MTRKHKTVAIGGTFDHLHRGHRALLRRALEVGERVLVGVTSDEFAKRLRKEVDEPYDERVAKLREFFKAHVRGRVEFVELNDYFGPAIFTDKVKAIVVSEETAHRIELANTLRRERSLRPLVAEVVPMVLAEDEKPISSTRIRRGEIDSEGKLL